MSSSSIPSSSSSLSPSSSSANAHPINISRHYQYRRSSVPNTARSSISRSNLDESSNLLIRDRVRSLPSASLAPDTSLPALPPPKKGSSDPTFLVSSSIVPTPNDDQYTIPNSSSTRKSTSSNFFELPPNSTKKRTSRFISYVHLHDRTDSVSDASTRSSRSSSSNAMIGGKSFAQHAKEPKDNKQEEIRSKNPDKEHFDAWKAIDDLVKNAKNLATSHQAQDLDKAHECWKQVIVLVEGRKDEDPTRREMYLLGIAKSIAQLKKNILIKKVVDQVLSTVNP
jgi:hypothetical protein